MRHTQVGINLAALRHNLQQVRKLAPHSRVMAAVKANGYGHGLERVALGLNDCDGFGVASIDEALELRAAGVQQPITLLEGIFHSEELALAEQHAFALVIHHRWQLECMLAHTFQRPVQVWLKIDTGMHRLGVPPEDVALIWQQLLAHPGLEPLGQMTHLACADNLSSAMTQQQLQRFTEVSQALGGMKSIANSAGILGWPQCHTDWVRPGIMLYGVSPLLGGRAEQHGLQPVMTLRSELIAVNMVAAGESIGYGATWITPETMPVGVVAVGYGDGYPRQVPNGTPVLLNGRIVPLVGRVSMDMVCVDLRSQPEATIGDPVVLWGEGLPVELIAEYAATIPYELLCGVTRRVDCVVTA